MAVREYDTRVKIDQVGIVGASAPAALIIEVAARGLGGTDAVWIVTHVAGRILAHDVLVVSLEACIAEDAVAVVTVITQGITGGVFGSEILCLVTTHEDGRVNRTMRPLGSRSPGLRSRIVIVASAALHRAALGQWCDQTRDIRIAARAGDGVRRRAIPFKFEPYVGLFKHSRRSRRRSVRTVGVATETKLMLGADRFYDTARKIDAADVVQRTRHAA